MTFFQTSEGRLHMGRIAGLVYVAGAAPQCIEAFAPMLAKADSMAREVHVLEPRCFLTIIFIAGWFLSFGAKGYAGTFSELVHPRGIIGGILMLFGLAGQFYFAVHR